MQAQFGTMLYFLPCGSVGGSSVFLFTFIFSYPFLFPPHVSSLHIDSLGFISVSIHWFWIFVCFSLVHFNHLVSNRKNLVSKLCHAFNFILNLLLLILLPVILEAILKHTLVKSLRQGKKVPGSFTVCNRTVRSAVLRPFSLSSPTVHFTIFQNS